tara:strand:- start:791 stop:2800 length:2010 start_codon:yes stop_codon:yes gene_type:complete
MALTNCKLVLDQHRDVVVGSTDLSSMDLYIVPNPGYFVDASYFTDNTNVGDATFPETIGVIDSITLTNTNTNPYIDDNQVKVTVTFSPSYSINEDTDITIDIDGAATISPNINLTLGISENISHNSNGIFSIQPTAGFTTLSKSPVDAIGILGDSEFDLANTSKLHFIQGTMPIGVETKVAEITFTALQSEANHIWHFGDWPGFNLNQGPEDNSYDVGGLTPTVFPALSDGSSGFRMESTLEHPIVAQETQSGYKVTSRTYSVYYTPVVDGFNFQDNTLAPNNYNSDISWTPELFGINTNEIAILSRNTIVVLVDKYIINSRTYLQKSQITRPLTITNISTEDLTNFGIEGKGAFNIIPSNGIQEHNRPTVRVFGDYGASFEIKFRESKVVEGVTGNRTIAGSADYFDGIIPDMPIGFVTIPKSGMYSFKMPIVASFLGTGYKEFEMIITGSDSTIIASSAVKANGTSYNVDAAGSIVTNKFYQYPSVNISFVVTKPADWDYQGIYTAATQLPNFGGGNGSDRKSGVALALVEKDPTKPSSNHTFNFEIRVKKAGGTFTNFAQFLWTIHGLKDAHQQGSGYYIPSSNPGTYDVTLAEYGFRSESFIPSVIDNGDVVNFSNLRLAVGEGLSDHVDDFNDFATISGRIEVVQFGIGNQAYTIDLETLFYWS